MNISSLDDYSLLGLISGAHSTGMRTEALALLYDRYGRLVYTIAIHIVGDPATAEEITQDVFVRAWEGAATYRPDMAKVSSWLVSITRHRSIDELRRRGVRPEKDNVGWPDDLGLDTMDGLPILDGPEGEVEESIQQHGLRQVIATLPSDQRQALGLAYFKGLSHSQIAELLGEPLGTVKSRIRLALQKVRDAMIEKGLVD